MSVLVHASESSAGLRPMRQRGAWAWRPVRTPRGLGWANKDNWREKRIRRDTSEGRPQGCLAAACQPAAPHGGYRSGKHGPTTVRQPTAHLRMRFAKTSRLHSEILLSHSLVQFRAQDPEQPSKHAVRWLGASTLFSRLLRSCALLLVQLRDGLLPGPLSATAPLPHAPGLSVASTGVAGVRIPGPGQDTHDYGPGLSGSREHPHFQTSTSAGAVGGLSSTHLSSTQNVPQLLLSRFHIVVLAYSSAARAQ